MKLLLQLLRIILLKSEYAEYNKKTGIIILKKDIEVTDNQNNKFKSNYAIYNEKLKTLSSIGNTEIITSENYIINSSDIVFDDLKKYIASDKKTVIIDQDNNRIVLDNFEYLIRNFIFKSVGNIKKVEDNLNNTYNFSQVYIDTKKKELLGTDIKTFINNDDFKINKKTNLESFFQIQLK